MGLKRFMGGAVVLMAGLGMTPPASAQVRVTNVVLVHGAWADGSGWQQVYARLTAKGFKVTVAQLPLTSLKDDVAATQRVVARMDGPTILVGHSYGGVVITEAGRDPKVTGLVYVSAFVPDAGESLLKMIEGAPEPPLQPSSDGFLFFNPAAFAKAFAQDLPAEQAAFLAAAQVPVAAAAFGTAVTDPAWKVKPSWYLVAADDHIVPPTAARAWAKRAGATVAESPGSHAIFMSRPQAVVDLIEAAASSKR
jgi:pimeloyl-ACP methyl ester carboxylesterase